MKITESIKRLYRLVTHHIGSGGDAHAIVNTIRPGFMTPQQLASIVEAKGLRTYLNAPEDGSKIDVLKLTEGRYYTNYNLLSNTPEKSLETTDNTAVVEIDVSIDTSTFDRKQIYFRTSSQGDLWTISRHESSVSSLNDDGWPKLWQKINKAAVLWSGSAIEAGTVLTLADKLINYRAVKVTYGVAGNPKTTVLPIRTNVEYNLPIREFNLPNNTTDLSFSLFEANLAYDPVRPSELRIISTTGRHVGGSSVTIDETTQIGIAKIEGVK